MAGNSVPYICGLPPDDRLRRLSGSEAVTSFARRLGHEPMPSPAPFTNQGALGASDVAKCWDCPVGKYLDSNMGDESMLTASQETANAVSGLTSQTNMVCYQENLDSNFRANCEQCPNGKTTET